MKHFCRLILALGLFLALLTPSGYAEGKYNDSKSGLYIYTNLLPINPANVLRWKQIKAIAVYTYEDEKGIKHTDDVTDKCNWDTDKPGIIAKLGKGSFYSKTVGTATITATYTEKKVSATKTIEVDRLKPVGNAMALRCAALSQLAYTQLLNSMANQTIEKLFTPTQCNGIGCQVKDDHFILKIGDIISEGNQTVTANLRDFIVAGAGDCTVFERIDKGAFSATVFKHGGKYIIAFRGTDPSLLDDLKSDINLGLGLIERNQFVSALELCQRYVNNYGKNNIIATGHSLGGGLANYVSVVTGVQALTFNAPSTMVTAFSNFLAGTGIELGKNYRGLNDDLRMDLVNQHDWVGKVGVGDSKYNELTGLSGSMISGRLDRTTFYQRNERITNGLPTNHDIKRMLDYDYLSNTIGLTQMVSATNPTSFEVVWNARTDYFGSTGPDVYRDDNTRYIQDHCLFSGAGNDVITLSGQKYQWRGEGGVVEIAAQATVVLGEGNDTFTDLGESDVKYHYYNGHGTDTINDHAGKDVLYLHDLSNPSVSQQNGQYYIKSGSSVIAWLNVKSNKPDAGYFEVYSDGSLLEHIDRGSTTSVNAEIDCPVMIEIYDKNDQLIETVPDGIITNGSGEYGSFSTFACDDGFGKQVSVASDDYRIKIIGLSDGTMRYRVRYEFEDSQNGWGTVEVPIYEGACYYPPMTYQKECILRCDYDGNGVMDKTVTGTGVETIELPATTTLKFGEPRRLNPRIMPSDAQPALVWISSDSSVLTVDEEGTITAVGFGEAEVRCYPKDDEGTMAVCEVSVPEEALSIEDCAVSGMKSVYKYTGEPIQPEIKLSFREMTLTEDVHYTLEYADNYGIGKASVTLNGIGCFTGTKKLYYTITEETVDEKADRIMEEFQTQAITGEWETALWLHDWLIYHADYDYTYTYYGADGVLLKGTGVCQSYSEAYRLLLNKAGIENLLITAGEMDHAWNMVKIDGKWCHIDCTWDDPGTGGAENHTYFGMDTALMGRDHQWNTSSQPSSEGLENYYPLRMGMLCFRDEADLTEIMARQAELKASPIDLTYIGSDSTKTALSVFEKWYGENNWKYGLRSYGASYSDYSCTLDIEYTDPWEKPENHLFEPVPAPDFILDSPVGRYRLADYANNGIMLIFGRDGCLNTAGLFDRLESELTGLNNGGIEVLVCVDDASTAEDLSPLQQKYNSFHYTYDRAGLLWDYLKAVGHDGQYVTYPCVFIINSNQMITYYSTGYVTNMDELIGEAFATATGCALPEPDKHFDITPMLNGTGNINKIVEGESIVTAAQEVSKTQNLWLILNSELTDSDAKVLAYYEAHYDLFRKLGLALVASFVDKDSYTQATYPHCRFVDYSNYDFWQLLYATEYPQGQSAYYRTNMFILKGGDIKAYTNGGMLNIQDCIRYGAQKMNYAMRIPDALKEIKEETFEGVRFESIDLTNRGLTRIGSRAFCGCGNLEIVRIPETVTYIADDAFENCGNPVVVCVLGSAGYRFAQDNGFDCILE